MSAFKEASSSIQPNKACKTIPNQAQEVEQESINIGVIVHNNSNATRNQVEKLFQKFYCNRRILTTKDVNAELKFQNNYKQTLIVINNLLKI